MCSAVNKRKRSSSNIAQPQKIQRIVSSLPDRMLARKMGNQSCATTTGNLMEFVMSMISSKGIYVKVQSFDSVNNFFCDPTKEEIEAYQHDVLTAVRARDIKTLRSFHEQGRPLKCSNQFGESLLHLACRKGMVDVAEFLVNEAGVPLSIRDDYGRSPLHDACWTPSPNFELVNLIISKCPDLLYISDQRGHTPLSYVRQKDWGTWKDFLGQKADLLIPQKILQQ